MPAATRRRAATLAAAEADDVRTSDVEVGPNISLNILMHSRSSKQHLRTALHGVAQLRSQIEHLTRENTRLREDLDRLYEAQDVSIQPRRGKKGNVSVLSLTAQVNKLKHQVAELEAVSVVAKTLLPKRPSHFLQARKKDRKKIRKVRIPSSSHLPLFVHSLCDYQFQMKEVKEDAMELGGELEYGVHDESADMKRVCIFEYHLGQFF